MAGHVGATLWEPTIPVYLGRPKISQNMGLPSPKAENSKKTGVNWSLEYLDRFLRPLARKCLFSYQHNKAPCFQENPTQASQNLWSLRHHNVCSLTFISHSC